MNLQDLLEMPTFLPPTRGKTIDEEPGTYISRKTAIRNYKQIGKFPLYEPIGEHQYIDILMSNGGKLVEGIIPSTRPIHHDEGYRIVFSLMFKDELPNYLPPDLQHSNVVQVDGVGTHKQFEGKGLATFVYFMLVKQGYTIISDFRHEFGGLKLWRTLAKLAGLNNYVVNILNNGEYIKDDKGNILSFNDGNYPKSKIWGTSPNEKHRNVLLVMRNV
jgi:hypothetical protein